MTNSRCISLSDCSPTFENNGEKNLEVGDDLQMKKWKDVTRTKMQGEQGIVLILQRGKGRNWMVAMVMHEGRNQPK